MTEDSARGPWRGEVGMERFSSADLLQAACGTFTLGLIVLRRTCRGYPNKTEQLPPFPWIILESEDRPGSHADITEGDEKTQKRTRINETE